MPFAMLFTPGLRVMRCLPFAAKSALIAVLAGLPAVAMLWQLLVGTGSGAGTTTVVVLCAIDVVALLYFLLAFHRSVSEDLGQVVRATEQMVAGDLRLAIRQGGPDELGRLMGSMGQLGRTVSAMVANVRSNAAFVAYSGRSLARASRDLSDCTEQQAANLEQTAASVEELSSTVQENAGHCRLGERAGWERARCGRRWRRHHVPGGAIG